MEMKQRHKQELSNCQSHNEPLIKARHEREWSQLEQRLANEIRSTDQKIILELDQLVSDQQSTLHQSAVPYFMITNNSIDIQLQSKLLLFIQRLTT